MTPIRIAVAGCGGKMGSSVVRLAAADAALRIVAGLERSDDAVLGRDLGELAGIGPIGVTSMTSTDANIDVLIEFSSPAGCVAWAQWCAARGIAMVSGTTGLSNRDRDALGAAASECPILWSPNMSIGVALLRRLVADAAARLGVGWDIEVVESHHRNKIDAPSGTARMLIDAIQGARSGTPDELVYGRNGARQRRECEIGVHALRLGGIVGEHEVRFAIEGEELTLSHRAISRDIFAAGALRAARWILGRRPGLYSMQDVLTD
ncbi:MAG: 4-hydroxy-tetrahydrodipicolinate reductase [Phycisphaerae bacterium]